jgi:primosomal protein N'
MSSVVKSVAKAQKEAVKAKIKAEKEAAKAAAKAEKEALKAEKAAVKAEAKAQKEAAKADTKKLEVEINKIADEAAKRPLIASDITVFSAKASRANNDAINKLRERILENALNTPTKFATDLVHGSKWTDLTTKLNAFLKTLCAEPYSSVKMTLKGGRGYHYDADIIYLNLAGETVSTKKLEFKYGASTIAKLPQFLSLQACNPVVITGITYDSYFYQHFLDAYIAADAGITVPKPESAEYLTLVKNTNDACHPFIGVAEVNASNGLINIERAADVAQIKRRPAQRAPSALSMRIFEQISERRGLADLLRNGLTDKAGRLLLNFILRIR